MSDQYDPKRIRNEYNIISSTYDQRYKINPLNGVKQALLDLVIETGARRALEIGCGTGHWLKALAPNADRVVGLDSSSGMLHQAVDLPAVVELVCGSADALPFTESSFDFIFVVNALHHFRDKRGFVEQGRNLLRPGGALAIVGADVDAAIGHWVIYDYFPGAIEYDQSRFPLWEQVGSWMREARLAVRPLRTVEHISNIKRGREILNDHFIQRYGASTFMGLTDAQYETGMNRIRAAIAEAEARGEEAVFNAELQLKMIVGKLEA